MPKTPPLTVSQRRTLQGVRQLAQAVAHQDRELRDARLVLDAGIARLRADGVSVTDIARECDLSRQTVYESMRRWDDYQSPKLPGTVR